MNTVVNIDIPQAPCVLSDDGKQWIVTVCPYCGLRHYHGAGDDPENYLGHRDSHCFIKSPSDKGYVLTQLKHMLDQIVRPITLSAKTVRLLLFDTPAELRITKKQVESPEPFETLWVKEPYAVVDDKIYYLADGRNNGFTGNYSEAKYMPRKYARMYILLNEKKPGGVFAFTAYK